MDNRHKDRKEEREFNERLEHLLGITYEEMIQLQHDGLREVTDSEQQIYKYYIHFSKENPAHILDKLDIDSHLTVYFSAAEWQEQMQ